jgi:hypothetical protein
MKKRRRVVKQQIEELKKTGSVIELESRPQPDKAADEKAADAKALAEKAVDEKPHDEKLVDEKALDEKKAPPDECLQLVEDISQEFKNM